MRASELENKPHLYLDMDGVQADFFGAWAGLHGVNSYKDIGTDEDRVKSIEEINSRGPEFVEQFFKELPPLQGGNEIVSFLVAHKIPFTVLSAPLRGNEKASVRGKIEWLTRHNPKGAKDAIFTHDKAKYATAAGKPNVLVDDYGVYCQRWRDAGGIAIKHKDDRTSATIQALKEIYLK